jgi:hypothetical protein
MALTVTLALGCALALATVLAGPPAAHGASTNGGAPVTTTSNPLSGGVAPLAPTPTTTTATPTATAAKTTSTTGSGSLTSTQAIAIAGGAIILLAGISFFIWRDARRRAPVRSSASGSGGDGGARPGSKPKPKPRKPSPAERRRRKRGRAKR